MRVLPIKGCTNCQYITDDGEVYWGKGVLRKKKNVHGYYMLGLNMERGRKDLAIHRLVCQHFVYNPKPDEYNQVNHIDGNRLNNHYTNLEWCNQAMNNKHKFDVLKIDITYRKPRVVLQMKDGIVIGKHKSIADASRNTGVNRTGIRHALIGMMHTCGGYVWKYEDTFNL